MYLELTVCVNYFKHAITVGDPERKWFVRLAPSFIQPRSLVQEACITLRASPKLLLRSYLVPVSLQAACLYLRDKVFFLRWCFLVTIRLGSAWRIY